MVRDKAKSDKDREKGKTGNPHLKLEDKGGVNARITGTISPEAIFQNHFAEAAAEAGELDEMGLMQEGMPKAAFAAECADRLAKPDMSIIKTWLLDGISVATISSAEPPIEHRKQDMKSLAYCDAAVRKVRAMVPPRAVPEVDRSGWPDHRRRHS